MLFRVALTLFKMNEQTVMSLNDSLEIFQVIQASYKGFVSKTMS